MVSIDALEIFSSSEEKPQALVVSNSVLAELPVLVDGCVRLVTMEVVSEP